MLNKIKFSLKYKKKKNYKYLLAINILIIIFNTL